LYRRGLALFAGSAVMPLDHRQLISSGKLA
jgi:hypothetical protein